MRKPPDDDRGPTWGAGFAIPGTPYIVLRSLGHGGMGDVYEVQDFTTGFVYAFKVLANRADKYPELAERIVREAEFLCRIKGAPYVVTVVAWGRLGGAYPQPYIVMERLYGEPLSTLIKGRALPLADTLSYAQHVLYGLAAVHGAGVVHRDLKPANIFVQRSGIGTLIDFSILKALYAIGLSLGRFPTEKGVPIGTKFYMAPEMASGALVDQRADIFSLGLVLAECALGHRLLPHLSEHAYLERLVTEGVPSLELAGGEHLPVEFRRLVRVATMFDPAKRFFDVHAFLLAINRLAEVLGLHLRPIPPSVHRAPDASPLWVPANHAVPTPSGYDSKAPTPRMHRAPLAPPGRAAPQRGAAAGLATPPTSSALPTGVNSVSPTQVKTPSPQSGPASTPPLRSRLRTLFGVSPRQGKRGEPPTTIPLPQPSTAPLGAPKVHARFVLRPGMLFAPVNDVLARPAPALEPPREPSAEAQPALESSAEAPPALESSAEAQPALEPSAEAQRPEGALPAASARPRRAPLVSAVMLLAAGGAAGVVTTLAAVFWADPSALLRVSPEPRRASPAGVVAPAPSAPEAPPHAPPHAPPAEAKPPEASPPAKPARPPASFARGDRRAQLEAKLQRGRGTIEEAEQLLGLCFNAGDEACIRLARDFVASFKDPP